jgi:flagellar basal body rod protein FlgG
MNTGLFSGVSALRASESRLEAITSNLANVSTPAYKRRTSVTHAFVVAGADGRQRDFEARTRIDFSQGPLQRTGNPLDVALLGDGFFAVDGPQGEIYTRAGSFRLDAEGNLLTPESFPVSWETRGGALDPIGDTVRIDEAGTVFQGEVEVGQLKIVAFEAIDKLQPVHAGYYEAPANIRRTPADTEVHQYALEGANTSAVDELVSLITVQRAFESAANLLRTIDQSYRRLHSAR